MKLTIKTLKGSQFEIRVQPTDTIMSVKKSIEDIQGKDNYPCGQQILIHSGKVLKDESSLAENNVSEDGFLVMMLSKTQSTSSSSRLSTQPAPAPEPIANTSPTMEAPSATAPVTYDQATSNVVADPNFEQTVQHIMDIGGGMWDKETVTRALRAAYNNPERAVDYLYSGIPETAEIALSDIHLPSVTAGASPASTSPNISPLDMFPQENLSGATGGGLGSLDFLRNNQQFQALRSMVQTNPDILEPMLQELGKQNPEILRQIQENHAEFLDLVNEPVNASEGNLFDQPEEDTPLAISVTPSEQEAIERLEAMGFDRTLVIEAFLACDRNEELAINYLLEHSGDYED
ncbi:Ubiquitin receptor RAD23 [Heracleum sosnowskyi]|uniref:Ubiquitin receptor RAD23 n=1 Tax=Heracleum sosnowskyi TaxID=360622 RepID=A0AAD8M3C9_9APIA|nr:Ubiquitin receptor RAD23 [Heracleum sosnowskyi]